VPPEYVFVDERASGARLDRPALDRLRDLAADGAFEVVLVAAPDRLARQYAYQVVVLEELTRAGCEVVFLNHAFGETPEQQMLLQIQGVFAEYERALIHERLRRGRL
jgi:site-specific DNA recombinase